MNFYRGPATDHFDGQHFFNPGSGLRGTGSVLRWLANRKPGPWHKWIDEPPGAPPPERGIGGKIRATFVGHSTVLIQMDGMNILTDPIWSMRASPFSWIGPRRHRAPGIRFEDLPSIDIVLQRKESRRTGNRSLSCLWAYALDSRERGLPRPDKSANSIGGKLSI